jgi:hypothetical protein
VRGATPRGLRRGWLRRDAGVTVLVTAALLGY